MTKVIAILLNNKLRLFLKRRSLHDILLIYCYLWVSAVINNSEIHSCKNITAQAHFIILISVSDGANERTAIELEYGILLCYVYWTRMYNWMKDMTSGLHGNLADISTGSEITPLHMEKAKKARWHKKKYLCFQCFSTGFESRPRFYIGH